MFESILDINTWGAFEWSMAAVAFALGNVLMFRLLINLDFWLARHMSDRFETVLGWILLPIVAAIACWWFAEDLQAAGLPLGWTIGIGVALFALYLASVPVRMWMSRKQ